MNDDNVWKSEHRRGEEQGKYAPANPEAQTKSSPPDPDTTDPATLPSVTEEAELPVQQSQFGGEHKISSDHSEPVHVTKTSNDNYIEGKYIDVGGGD